MRAASKRLAISASVSLAADPRPTDDVAKMIEEARVLTDTYCDGVGIYAFRERSDRTGYEPAALGRGVSARVTGLDAVLCLIAAQIAEIMSEHGNHVPAPMVAASAGADAEP
jgi:hypothetical protein